MTGPDCGPDSRLPLQQVARHRQRFGWRGWWVVILLAIATIWGWLDVRRRGYPHPNNPTEHRTDFTVYTEAGAAFFDGRPPYDVANPRGWTYLYPPMFAMLVAPLHLLPTQDQVTVWFFVSLLVCWGCCRECGRLLRIVCAADQAMAARCTRWFPWLGIAAVAVGALPALNCLQRGQVGILKFYLLLLGVRLILGGRGYRAWLAGGLVLATPVVLKIVPVLPVVFLLFLQLVAALRHRGSEMPPEAARRRWAASTVGVGLGVLLLLFVIPAALVGWDANLKHLDTWAEFMLTKADDGGVDPRSGNSRGARNQSLQNAAYRLGNFAAHVLAGGPDDRLVENIRSPVKMVESPAAATVLESARVVLLLALSVVGIRLGRQRDALSLAVGFALACVAMLVVSPVARGHYFMLLVPAVLLLPLWLDRHGMPRAGAVLAAAPAVLVVLHYLLLGQAGRIGLLGLGTTCWLMAAVVLVDRAGRRSALARAGITAPTAGAAPTVPLGHAA